MRTTQTESAQESKTNIYFIGEIATENNDQLFGSSKLLQLNGSNKFISAVKVKAGFGYAMFTDKNGNHYAFGCNTLGSCGIEKMSSANTKISVSLPSWVKMQTQDYTSTKSEEMVVNVYKIEYFIKLGISIYQLFTNTMSWTTFWLSSTNKLYGSGKSTEYRFGLIDNVYKRQITPKRIKLPKHMGNIIDIQSGDFHSLYLDDKGNVYSTKYTKNGKYGQNGHSNTKSDDEIYKKSPHKLRKIMKFNKKINIIKIGCGDIYSLFLDNNGMVYSCGKNGYGQLGLGHNKTDIYMSPTKINHFIDNNIIINHISCGESHNLALDKNGFVYSWGSNRHGQCGCGDDNYSILTPIKIYFKNNGNATKIKCGSNHSYIGTTSQQYFLFGNNNVHQCTLQPSNEYKIWEPFCINHIFTKLSKYKYKWIKDIGLGNNSTYIIGTNVNAEYLTFGFIKRIADELKLLNVPQEICMLCKHYYDE